MLRSLIIGLCFLSGLISCGPASERSADSQTGSGKRLAIAMIPKGTTHSYWKTVHAGAQKAAKELDVTLYWQGPLKEDDRQIQIQTVQNFISRGVDAIALAPLDARSLVAPVKTARNRGIPVIIFDSDLASTDFLSFVATDNREGGRLCAERMSQVLGGKGKVILLRYSEGSASNTHREEGFLEGIKQANPALQLISTDQYAGVTMEKALQVAQNLLNRYPDVNGIFCPNEITTQAMLRALRISGKAGQVKLIGFDANETLLQALQQGDIQGLAVQDPYKMGYLTIKTAVQAVKKQPVEKRIDTGVAMVTADNVQDAKIKALLHPETESEESQQVGKH